MEDSGEIKGPPIEAAKGSEKKDSRGTVIRAFNSGVKSLREDHTASPTPQKEWAIEALRGEIDKRKDVKVDEIPVTFDSSITGERFTQDEGIPVNYLIDYLREKARSLPKGDPEKVKLTRTANILTKNSKPYIDFPHRTEQPQQLERIRHEANLMSKDSRATENPVENWLMAESEILTKRRELILPPEKAKEEKKSETESTVLEPETEPSPAEDEPIESEPTSPVPEPEPTSTPVETVMKSIAFVNRNIDIRKRAEGLAEERLREERKAGNNFNPLNWYKKFKLRVGEEYWRQKYIQEAMAEMRINSNSYLTWNVVRENAFLRTRTRLEHGTESHREEERAAGIASAESVGHQYEAGERLEGTNIVEIQGELRNIFMNELVNPVRTDAMNYEQFQEHMRNLVGRVERNEIPNIPADQREAFLNTFGREATKYGNAAEYFATDLFAHNAALEQINETTKILLANASWAAETQGRFSLSDRIIAWSQRNRGRSITGNAAAVGASIALGAYVGVTVAGVGGRFAANFIPGTGLITGALFSAARRSRDLKIDMAAHRRERTYGRQKPEQNAPRRRALENYAYATSTVNELLNGRAENDLLGGDGRGLRELLNADLTNPANRDACLRRAAEVKARLDFSTRERADLIGYSNEYTVEQGRLELLRGYIETRQKLQAAGIGEDEITQAEGRWNTQFTQNREQQDRRFLIYRARNAARSAVFGGAAGLAGGIATQEVLALVGRGLQYVDIDLPHIPGAGIIGAIAGEIPGSGKVKRFSVRTTRGLFAPGRTRLEAIADGDIGSGILGEKEQKRSQSVREQLRGLFKQDKEAKLDKNLFVHANSQNPDHMRLAGFSTGENNTNPVNFSRLVAPTESGSFVVPGDTNISLPPDLQALKGDNWEMRMNNDPTHNLFEKFKLLAHEKERQEFRFGRSIYAVDPAHSPTNSTDYTVIRQQINFDDPFTGKHIEGPEVFKGYDVSENKVIFDSQNPGNAGRLTDQEIALVKLEDEKDGYQYESAFTAPETKIINKSVLGPDGEWSKHTTKIDERQWYAYGTQVSEENELRQYSINKIGNKVTLDMSKMKISSQPGLESVNVQDVIARGEAAWAICLPGQEDNPIIISDGMDGAINGRIEFNPDAPGWWGEFSKILLNQPRLDQLPDGDIATEYYTEVLGENRLDVWRINGGETGKFGTISAGRLVEHDGKKIWQSFATIRGSGATPTEISETITVPGHEYLKATPPQTEISETITVPGHEYLKATPPQAVEFTPKTIPFESSPPFIPIPAAPRHDLEKTLPKAHPILYDLYAEVPDTYSDSALRYEDGYGRISPETYSTETTREMLPTKELEEKRITDQKRYLDRIRKRYTVDRLNDSLQMYRTGYKKDGTKASSEEVEQAGREARRLQTVLTNLNKEPRDYIQELEEVNTSLPVMRPDVQFSIVIPAYGEASRIRGVLESWTNQLDKVGNPISPSQFEILVLVNRPNETREFDGTRKEIENFKREHPELANSIVVVEKTFNFPMVTKRTADGKEITVPDVRMGTIYRYATDLTLLRNLTREEENPERIANHIIRTGGADAVMRNPRHVDSILASFRENPAFEQYVSLSDYHPDVYRKVPLLFLTKALQEDMNEYLTKGLSNVGLGTYRTALYAEAGGFEPTQSIAEEVELSKRIRRTIRSRGEDITAVRRRDLILNAIDDPRRDIATLFIGRPITRAYDDYEVNEAIRGIKMEEVLRNSIPKEASLTTSNFTMQATAILRFYLNQFFDPTSAKFEPETTEATITQFTSIMRDLGINPESISITFNGKPYSREALKDAIKLAHPIDEIRNGFSVSVSALPTPERIEEVMKERFTRRDGAWVFETIASSPSSSSAGGRFGGLRSKAETALKTTRSTVDRATTGLRERLDSESTTETPLPPELERPASLRTSDSEHEQTENIVENINRQLAETPETISQVEIEPSQLANYLQTIPLPRGAQLENLNTRVEGGNIVVTGSIGAIGARSQFSATLHTLPTGQIQVISHTVNPALRHRPFIGQIDSRIANLNDSVVAELNNRIDPSWKTSGFNLVDGNIRINFAKTITGERRVREEQAREAIREMARREGITEEEAARRLAA